MASMWGGDTHIIVVHICRAGMHDAVVVQQLDVASLENIVHSQLCAVSQVFKGLQGTLLQVCHLRHVLMPGG